MHRSYNVSAGEGIPLVLLALLILAIVLGVAIYEVFKKH